jgi:type IV secretory pathway VirJ component
MKALGLSGYKEAVLREDPNGEAVLHSDYARLEQERDALKDALRNLEDCVMREGLERTSDEVDKRSAERFLALMDAIRQARAALATAQQEGNQAR